jgi:hypothetical protein
MADTLDSDRKSSFQNRATMESVNKRAPKDKDADLREASTMSKTQLG